MQVNSTLVSILRTLQVFRIWMTTAKMFSKDCTMITISIGKKIYGGQNALKTLPALLDSSDMLACGEDLGLVPACVHPVMQELGLIGLRIQRMSS
ncbi:hypothetical protein OIU79_028868, partial [Salix purpurea]